MNEKEITMQEEEIRMYDAACRAVDRITALNPDMMFDPKGKRAFVLVAFNHLTDPDLLPADASSDDKLAAVSAVTLTLMPYAKAKEDGIMSDDVVVKHGVQAVAASLLTSILQQSGITSVLQMAQAKVLQFRRKTND